MEEQNLFEIHKLNRKISYQKFQIRRLQKFACIKRFKYNFLKQKLFKLEKILADKHLLVNGNKDGKSLVYHEDEISDIFNRFKLIDEVNSIPIEEIE